MQAPKGFQSRIINQSFEEARMQYLTNKPAAKNELDSSRATWKSVAWIIVGTIGVGLIVSGIPPVLASYLGAVGHGTFIGISVTTIVLGALMTPGAAYKIYIRNKCTYFAQGDGKYALIYYGVNQGREELITDSNLTYSELPERIQHLKDTRGLYSIKKPLPFTTSL